MKDIREKLKLIALFMGGNIKDSKYIWLPIHGICRHDTTESGKGMILNYHKSWDWLIPVVDKIYSSDEYYKCKEDQSGMFSRGLEINTKYITVTFDDVVDYIEWFNKIKK
jgi:hypothetical protein